MNKLNHVAFIMDGNGRWGQKKKKGRNFGHINGVKTVKKTVETAAKYKIPFVTFYVFSTENWKRPKSEVNFLFKLITIYFKQEIQNVISKGIKINIFGKISNLPNQIKSKVKTTDVALKGQTVSSSYKPAILDNGINIQVPPFIESGDEIVLDTRTVEYIKKI